MPDPRGSQLHLAQSPVCGHVPLRHVRAERMVSVGLFAQLSAVRVRGGSAQHCPPSVCTFCVQPRILCCWLCVPRYGSRLLAPAPQAHRRQQDRRTAGPRGSHHFGGYQATPGSRAQHGARCQTPPWLATATGQAGRRLLGDLGSPSNRGPGWACTRRAVGPREWHPVGSQAVSPQLVSGPGEGLGDSCMVQGQPDIF